MENADTSLSVFGKLSGEIRHMIYREVLVGPDECVKVSKDDMVVRQSLFSTSKQIRSEARCIYDEENKTYHIVCGKGDGFLGVCWLESLTDAVGKEKKLLVTFELSERNREVARMWMDGNEDGGSWFCPDDFDWIQVEDYHPESDKVQVRLEEAVEKEAWELTGAAGDAIDLGRFVEVVVQRRDAEGIQLWPMESMVLYWEFTLGSGLQWTWDAHL